MSEAAVTPAEIKRTLERLDTILAAAGTCAGWEIDDITAWDFDDGNLTIYGWADCDKTNAVISFKDIADKLTK